MGRADRPDHSADRPGRARHHRGPPSDRGRRAPVRRGPKCRKYRKTIYPRRTPDGYPLAEKLAARIEQATAEYEAGTNPLGLIFPSPTGKHWRSSNFNRNVLKRAYLAIGWRDADGNGKWTWHSLRHVFCTTALFT